ncbi:MAG TPA: ribonuclease P protein component [Anaerovoracaceae bacterium]|nr:ribonuclease P protein component [Anaerovoracaceae bacterium]
MLNEQILRNQKDFKKVYKKGKSKSDRLIVVLYVKNNFSYSRIAFLASKKVGNSVKRNRAKRLMKQAFKNLEIELKEGYDIIFIARNTINDTKCYEVEKSIKNAISRTKELRK